MWRPSSPSGRPRPPRRSGTALASWSETIRTGARPSGFSIRTGSGSAGESRDKGRLREGGRREGGRFVVVRNRAEVNGRPRPSRDAGRALRRSEEHTSELQSLMRISYAVFCLKKKKTNNHR